MTRKSASKGKASTKASSSKTIESLTHHAATRPNLPTAEHRPFVDKDMQGPVPVRYRRNPDLDPQLIWRGKYKDTPADEELTVQAPPLYVQEKIHPRALIEDLKRQTRVRQEEDAPPMPDLFGDFNGLPSPDARTEFYQHEQHWQNRLILGDSLQVMASLTEREDLRGKVQCVYFDPPYGIKFNSNFQWSTTSRDVKDGNVAHITREPEQVKAFRDTWRDGIHSYLSYIRDRLLVAKELLHESGSIFVQIGDENVHRVRAVMDEVFGERNFVSFITLSKTTSSTNESLSNVADYILWFAKDKECLKYRPPLKLKDFRGEGGSHYSGIIFPDGVRKSTSKENSIESLPLGSDLYTASDLQSAGMGREKGEGAASWFPVELEGRTFRPTMQTRWKTSERGMQRLIQSNRVLALKNSIRYLRKFSDFPAFSLNNIWNDLGGVTDRRYVVETSPKIVERCILMTTDPGDIVLDPTCGSGTTAYVAEQWGRRWITIDTSRVAIALARARIMGARYPFYLLADSPEGQIKEAELSQTMPSRSPTGGDIRQGFVYKRVPHITLKSIANNAEIDVIWERWQETLGPLRLELNKVLGQEWQEWEIPREAGEGWSQEAQELHAGWWEARIGRQREIDASIAAKAEYEYLYDDPVKDDKRVRVAGPFTVESVLPHRTLGVDEDGELIDPLERGEMREQHSFEQMIMEQLRSAGVQQADKSGRITFTSLQPAAGYEFFQAEGTYLEGEGDSATLRRAAILIGPEFGTVQRIDLTEGGREARENGFDILIACAFAFEAQTTELNRMGSLPVLKARMNADLHMGGELAPTGKGNLFVVFGEPDIEVLYPTPDTAQVKVRGVDVFHPASGEVRPSDAADIACWFIDTNYDSESFFVRHAYFLGAGDPYGALKTTLRAEVEEDAWASLNSDTSRSFPMPTTGRIAIKVINHLGDEVMKVYRVNSGA